MSYFSDRDQGPQSRTGETISAAAWGGFVALVQSNVNRGAFGGSFPELCSDGQGTYSTDAQQMGLAVMAEIPLLARAKRVGSEPLPWGPGAADSFQGWPLRSNRLPSTAAILDLVEFCHRHVADPVVLDHHGFMRHDHLRFEVQAGRTKWKRDVNRLFGRNGLAYELSDKGEIFRLGTPVLTGVLQAAGFATGDAGLDNLLERARRKYLSTDETTRAESLEQLWDSFERAKTLLDDDKRVGIGKLLDRAASSPELRVALEAESRALTEIGNQFRIRHHETTKIAIDPGDVDYVFHRCFAFLARLLELNPSA